MTFRFLGAALALASLAHPTIAAAQVADRAAAPSGTAPLQAPCIVQDNGTCAAVKSSVPLPTQEADGTPVSTTSASSATTVFSVDTIGFKGLTFSMTGTYVLGTQTECSNDNVNWLACQVLDTNSNSYTNGPNSQNRAYYAPAVSRYFRLRVASYTSGTLNAVAFLRQTNIDPGNITISGNPGVQGVTAVGNTAAGSPLRNGCVSNNTTPTARANGAIQDVWCTQYGAPVVAIGDYQSGNFAPLQAGSIQAKSATTTGLPVDANLRSYNLLSNAWLRILDANTAAGTAGDGLLGVGNLGWDGAAWQRQRIAAGGGLLVADQDGLPVLVTPGTTTGNVLFSTTTNGFAGVSFQTGSAANGSTWNFQASNDSTDGVNGNWFSINAQQVNGSPVTATQTANAGFFIPAVATYVRVILSGTVTAATGGTAVLRSIAPMPVNIGSQTINNNKSQWNTEANNVAVAAGAAAIGYTIRDTGQAGGDYRFNYFSCLAVPSTVSVGMTLRQLASFDNSRFFVVRTDVVPSGTTAQPLRTSERIFARYNRCQLDNSGGNAAVNVDVMSQYGE